MSSTMSVVSIVFITLTAQADPPKPAATVEGIWEGTLRVQAGIELRLGFTFTKQADGTFNGTMDSIDQGANNLPLDDVKVADGALELAYMKGKMTFVGKLSADSSTIAGTLKQSGLTLPLELKRVEKKTEVSRPQEPKKPYPYREEEVIYENASAGVKLAATLTLPKGEGPFPAVLLITGSGPQDRNESLLGHKPFLVIADHLTRKGIAVLRADDRGTAKSTGDFSKATTEDFTQDALAGVAFLKGRKEIDPKRIGLAGHSEGGLIAPLAAVKSPDVAFVILLAGPGLPGSEILQMQRQIIAKGMGISERAMAWGEVLQRRFVSLAAENLDEAAAKAKIKTIVAEEVAKAEPDLLKEMTTSIAATMPDGTANDAATKDAKPKSPDDMFKESLERAAARVLTPWFRYFLTYDPRPTLRKVKVPVLALNGEKDSQVPPRENLAAIAAALKEAGNADVTINEMPGLNHLFQTCKSGLPMEYAKIEETFAPAALDAIAEWVLKRK